MHEIKAIIRRDRLESVLDALHQIAGVPGITVSTVTGFGRRQPTTAGAGAFGEVEMTKLEVVVSHKMLPEALGRIRKAAYTGHAGDGKVFVFPVEQAMKIRSDEQGIGAL